MPIFQNASLPSGLSFGRLRINIPARRRVFPDIAPDVAYAHRDPQFDKSNLDRFFFSMPPDGGVCARGDGGDEANACSFASTLVAPRPL
jgi:hypothetical protein